MWGHPSRRPLALFLPLGLALSLGACANTDRARGEGPLIVATTSILGDVTANLVDQAASVETIMPPGADPHDFEPSARQAALMREADLLVVNGLGLEEGLSDVIGAAAADGVTVLELAPLLDPLPFAAGSEGGKDSLDPHVWQDPVRMATAVELIAESLTGLDTGRSGDDWTIRAARYQAEIMATHEEIEGWLAPIPPQDRKIVTNHEAFGYFAARYGFTIIGVVIPGGSTLAEPSPGQLADLIEMIENEGVRAIFAENTDPTLIAEAVAEELGEQVAVIELYTDSLGPPGSPAGTYLGMLRENARLIAQALG